MLKDKVSHWASGVGICGLNPDNLKEVNATVNCIIEYDLPYKRVLINLRYNTGEIHEGFESYMLLAGDYLNAREQSEARIERLLSDFNINSADQIIGKTVKAVLLKDELLVGIRKSD